MLGYSEEALNIAKNYMVGGKPNEVYLYKGKLVTFFGIGGKYRYSDAIAAFDCRTGERLNFSIFGNQDFWAKSKKLA